MNGISPNTEVGTGVGSADGFVGCADGCDDGEAVGLNDGTAVGINVGDIVGFDGEIVGE